MAANREIGDTLCVYSSRDPGLDVAMNAASEGCHSTGQLVIMMSDTQTTMSNDTLEKIVCLRNSRTAVTALQF